MDEYRPIYRALFDFHEKWNSNLPTTEDVWTQCWNESYETVKKMDSAFFSDLMLAVYKELARKYKEMNTNETET